MILFVYRMKTSNADHVTYFFCIYLYIIKIIKNLDQSFIRKCLWTQQAPSQYYFVEAMSALQVKMNVYPKTLTLESIVEVMSILQVENEYLF